MEINLNQQNKTMKRSGVSIGKLSKETVFIDSAGNKIDPVTKQIIEETPDKE